MNNVEESRVMRADLARGSLEVGAFGYPDDDRDPFVDYAEEWNNYPSARVAAARRRKGWERGMQWGRFPENWQLTPKQMINFGRSHHWSPDYVEGVYDAVQYSMPARSIGHDDA